ncbi:type IV secretory system conjugative DNA transfer family protein [Dactylosporangium sp. CA-152071]|uniref:type IV secretory system conjugative DNA transfer family protein n=1 Tax=Dactylosporangium sp. CA-152071 TaxID=3239933 RepID=UPI003D95038E
MRRPPLSAPGHHLPKQGLVRADIVVRLAMLGIVAVVLPTLTWTLWLAGQVGGVVTHFAWPDTTPGDAPGVAVRIAGHVGDPVRAWPAAARGDLPPAVVLYLLWLGLFLYHAVLIAVPAIAAARRLLRRRGFARRGAVRALLSPDAVLARADIVRPGLTVREADTPQQRAAKEARRRDPHEVGRLLGTDVLTGEKLFLANEYTLVAAAAARFGGKTSRCVIPRVLDARGAVISTSTRLDVAAVTYARRAGIGPTHVFEPQGEIPLAGIERLRWSPIEGAEDQIVAMLRASGFASGSGVGSDSVENGKYFQDQAASLIRGLLHAAALDGNATMVDVLAWSQNPSDARPERILRHHGVHSWADRLARHRETTGRARDTIQSVMSGALDAFNDPRVLAACSPPRGSQFDTLTWLAQSGTIYLVGTRDAQALIAPLLGAVTEDLLYQAKRAALTASGGRIEPTLYLVGDEIANVAPIQSLPSLMTEGGGSGIAIDLFMQNKQQPLERWGDKAGRAINASANCELVIGGSSDVQGLKDAQSLAGQILEVSSGHSWGGGRASVSENVRRENLLDLAELRTLPEGRALAFVGNLPPVELQLTAWWERPDGGDLTADRDRFQQRIAKAA